MDGSADKARRTVLAEEVRRARRKVAAVLGEQNVLDAREGVALRRRVVHARNHLLRRRARAERRSRAAARAEKTRGDV